jgi:ParB-like chromosome segregation protein Spo0J
MKLRDRVKELRRVRASELRPNPKNWRTHPTAQLDALRGVLAEVGVAGAALARELEDGTLELIDGHARAETCGDEPIPVLVLDVTAEEADKLLATFDPLGAMAGIDASRLEGLLNDVSTESAAVQELLDGLAKQAGLEVHDGAGEDAAAGADVIPEQFQILVECASEEQQAELLERLAGEGLKVRSLIS